MRKDRKERAKFYNEGYRAGRQAAFEELETLISTLVDAAIQKRIEAGDL